MSRKSRGFAVFVVCAACGGQTITTDGGTDANSVALLPIDKVDVLLMIDNSASMADKQDFLVLSVPDLVTRLLLPRCLESSGAIVPRDANNACPMGTAPEFAPVTDMHIGIVTSSMGGGGAQDICLADAKIQASESPTLVKFNRHNDDKAHLVNRKKPDINPPPSGVEDPVADAVPSNFLAWLPDVPQNSGKTPPPVTPIKDTRALTADFQDLVRVQEFGCGLESQLESWYRFLVQPDPYDSIQIDNSQAPAAAQLVGVDSVILQQRHDFLRPDSLLSVIVITDEEDSWTDPMWLGGRGWITRALIPGNEVNTGPNDPSCQWCAFKGTETDPNCATNKGIYSTKDDGLNVRYTNDMKRRYGMNPQFPISRYTDGLQSRLVPDRTAEHYTTDNRLSSTYVGRKTCSNPIFSRDLPTDPNGELCKLKPSGRTPDQVLFTIIGGVPWQLLTQAAGTTENTNDPAWQSSAFKASLSATDWQRILGQDPSIYDYTGQNIHMQESIRPRATPCGLSSANNCDGFNGREWDTLTSKIGIDLQFACVFPILKPRDCTQVNGLFCDCWQNYAGPLCDPNPADGNNPTLQTRGKAYPAIRELRLAKDLGPSGIAASICVRSLDMQSPDFAYRPAIRATVDRMASVFQAHNKH